MILQLADWEFRVDMEATAEHTTKNSLDHCDCAYCRNYYEALAVTYPKVRPFLARFGVNPEGPSELLPFAPTLVLACYRVQGEILRWGYEKLTVGAFPVTVEAAEEGSFFLWVGEVPVPWLQDEPMEEVVSPANLPEFLERMEEVWLLRHGNEFVFS